MGWRQPRALSLAVSILGTGGMLWVAYQTVGMQIRTQSTSGITLSLVWGELLMFERAFLRVWMFAADSDLQNSTEEA